MTIGAGLSRIVVTRTATATNLYHNGVLRASGSGSTGNDGGQELRFGRPNTFTSTDSRFNGPAFDLRVYRRAWTADEARRDYIEGPYALFGDQTIHRLPLAAVEPRTRRTISLPWDRQPQEAQNTTLSQRWIQRGLQAVITESGLVLRDGGQRLPTSMTRRAGGLAKAKAALTVPTKHTLFTSCRFGTGTNNEQLLAGYMYFDGSSAAATNALTCGGSTNLANSYIYWYSSDAFSNLVYTGASGVDLTGAHTIAATSDGTGVNGSTKIYVDGKARSVTNSFTGNGRGSASGTFEVGGSTSGDAVDRDLVNPSAVEIAALFSEDLTADEIAELSADPMSLVDIGPISQRIPSASSTWTRTTSLSAVIQVVRSLTANLGGAVQAGQSLTATAGAAIVAAQSAQSALEAAVQQARAAVATLDAAVQAGAAQSASLAAALQLARSATSALDLAVQAQGSQTASLSAQVQAAQQVSTSLSAQVQAGSSVSVAIAASVLRQAAAAVGIDLAVQAPGAQTATLSAALQVARTAATALESAVQIARTASAGVSAQVQLGSAQSAALDVAVLRAFVAAAGVQAAVAVAGQANLSLGAAVALQRSVVAAIEPVIMHRLALGAGVSAYVYDGSAPTFYPPLARRTVAIRAELRTLSIRAEQRTLKIR